MLLAEIFEQLSHGELGKLFIGGIDDEGINVNSHPELVAHINLGLLELHKRFPIKIKEIAIQQYSTITEYYLQEKYATNSGSAESPLYLLDTPNELFKANVLKIEKVTTTNAEITGNMPLNDSANDDSIYTTAYNTLKVPTPNDVDILTVSYRASHDLLIGDGIDPDTTEIEIPYSLLDPLLLFVASRVHANTPSLDGQQNDSMLFLQKYEASIALVEQHSLIENTHTTNTKLDDNGWV
jgi:hypothetical protein